MVDVDLGYEVVLVVCGKIVLLNDERDFYEFRIEMVCVGEEVFFFEVFFVICYDYNELFVL